ncbi:hypothetical protein BKA67DRAFT_97073 [Truncatella angustata]|uniref:Uncharacterized protein n=1 Tax=Truncatella angustata TaxID=152316 RepID=A0A9P8RHR0_9PEZI|nr:uncharacterized protein BKA67DRAFT_97073 [Truncatella angustata]KAH6646239.1 hypothetical protein BKA67DRAFT_97073 [Truncatella angustata]KAH8203951.1 hypothetical protein TruAng_001893 [Truncatella angustata]
MATFPLSRDNNQFCDCQNMGSLLMDDIDRASGGLTTVPPPAQPHSISIDCALLLGHRLTLQWERINGCFNVEEHLDPGALLTVANAIERVLKLYEVGLESTKSHRQSRATSPSDNASPSSRGNYPSSSRFQVTAVPTSLGELELDDEEARIVAQEALRYMISRLGEMLKDIEEEDRQVRMDPSGSQVDLLGEVKRARELMLRLLGRVPR